MKVVSFISKKIEDENNLGSQLKAARKEKGLALDMAASQTGIEAKYLRAFEDNDFKVLPEGIYRDKFLKRYSQFLDIEEKSLIVFPINDNQSKQEELYNFKIGEEPILKKINNFILSPIFLKNALILTVFILGIAYLGFLGYNIVKEPKLSITSPVDDFITNEFSIEVQGKTEKEAKVFINDQEIYCLQKGSFNEKVDLKKGINIVKISAKKKYGKEHVVFRNILVKDQSELGLK